MTGKWIRWPQRTLRWLFGSPFRTLPPAFGNPVPPDLQAFEAQEADQARHGGFGAVSQPMTPPHAKTRPARQDPAVEHK